MTHKRYRLDDEQDQQALSGKKRLNNGDHLSYDEEPGRLEKFIKNSKTIETLKRKGVKSLFPVQYMTYECIHSGEDIIARDKTGSGKTLAFALPIIERMRKENEFSKNHLPKFIILLPTRELALQVKDEIDSLKYRDETDFRAIAVYGKSDINYQIQRIKSGIDIIVGTPGRLIDLLQRDVIKMNELKVLCLDEADQMLKIGFKEAIEQIYEYITKNTPKKPQNLLFSATIPLWLKQISRTYQDPDCKFVNLIREEDLTTPASLVHMCLLMNRHEEINKSRIVFNLLQKFANKSGNAIIFCEKKADVERMSNSLSELGLRNEPLHGDVPQGRRENAYRNFKSGALKYLIATNVAARGLDFPQIDLVIQIEPPNNVESYIHRSGRTARKGKQGICITLFTEKTERLIKNIEKDAKIYMKNLNAVDFTKKIAEKESNEREKYDKDEGFNRRENGNSNFKGEYEIYMKYLPTDKSEQDVRQFFQGRGVAVQSIKFLHTDGVFKGCGFIKMASKKDRDRCLELEGERWDGRSINLSVPKVR